LKEIGKRLIQIRGELSQKEFATKAGISQNSVSRYENGTTEPGSEVIARICRTFQVDSTWLLTGEGLIHKGFEPTKSPAQDGSILVPLSSFAPSAGGGAFCDGDYIKEWVPVPKVIIDWAGVPPKSMCLVHASGTSMEPTIRDGELLFLDRRCDYPNNDGVYVLRIDSVLVLKRLQVIPGGALQILSDNPAFPPITVSPKSPPADFQVLARVVANLRKV